MDIFGIIIFTLIAMVIIFTVGFVIWLFYRETLRSAKNYERGLKMVSYKINLPPSSTDIEGGGRDQRDLTDEIVSQAQVMYNILSSTASKGFTSKLTGQRHISFEIIVRNSSINYYVVSPLVLSDVVKQAISTAYPASVIQEVREESIFSEIGKANGVSGGEFSLKKDSYYPILTYKDSKQDASRSLLNALSSAKKSDGIALQFLIRPASEGWVKSCENEIKNITNGKSKKSFFSTSNVGDLLELLWKPLQVKDDVVNKPISNSDSNKIQIIDEKMKFPAFESLIRVVVSSNTFSESNSLLQNIISSFSLFDSQIGNGFKFNSSKSIEDLITSYIMRFFPQDLNNNVLNSVELASVYHLPSQKDIPSSQVTRQMSKQVDGPMEAMSTGLMLGYNEYRGVKKPIRLSDNDRRRHTYFIGQTGTGKSGLLENLAYQDIMDGKGFAFIDPHGDSAEKIMGMIPKERVDDVIYFCPGDLENPVGLNLFEFETDDQRDFLVQEAIQMLYKLYDPGHTGIIGPRFEHWFRNAALTIMSDPNGSTFIDIPQIFADQSFTDYKLQFVKDQTVLDFWNKEMSQTTESSKSDMLGFFTSKFGAFLSNEMMRNIIGQTKSGFNIREIMDNKKILLVNLSKGKTGELNSMLLGMVFIMKFQVAAMSRADMPEEERQDFCLYVDEFQNFATDSFESILSEARKYRLNIIVANQFMTQLTDKIREAIIGNVGTIISGRIGITDAEILQKKFSPVFTAEDLTKLPNFQTITSVMINNVPSAPFSMNLLPPMGKSKPELRDALKKLSASKYGMSRQEVANDIYERLSAGDKFKAAKEKNAIQRQSSISKSNQKNNFLDDWLKKRNELNSDKRFKQTNQVNPVKNSMDILPDSIRNTNDSQPQPLTLEETKTSQSGFDFRSSKNNEDKTFEIKIR